MKSAQELLFEKIKVKINALIAENNALKGQLNTLENKYLTLENTLEAQKNNIKTLQTQNKIAKLAEVLPQNVEERTQLKKELKGFIKQIDDCIRLLSETKA